MNTAGDWSEADSRAFLDAGDVFVPDRDEQVRTLCALVPAARDEAFTAAELGAGGGVLARAVLETFPRCRYLALDRSPAMREHLAAALARHRARVEVRAFELGEPAWREALPSPLRCVLASLVVHHLDGAGKRELFADLARRLAPGGAFLLADLIEPLTPAARTVFAQQWDEAARAQSLARTGGLEAYRRFDREHWNFYRDPKPDPLDRPSRLVDQLDWLREAGLTRVDCFWMRAGHAIFGGYKSAAASTAPSGASIAAARPFF